MKKSILLFLLVAAFTLTAAPITYDVNINTTSAGTTSGFVYFEFLYNSGTPSPSTVSVTAFTPQAPLGAIDTAGNVTGTLASTLALTAASPVSYYAQEFNFNLTPIRFQITFDALPGGTVPSTFNFALTDSVGSPLIATNDPFGAGNIFTASFNNRGNVTVQSYNLESGAPAATLSQVPEPATLLLTAIPLGAFALLRRRR